MPRMLPVLLLLLGGNLVAFGQADMPKPAYDFSLPR